MLFITAISASVLALLYIQLAFKVIGYRRRFKVSIGDGGEDLLKNSIRAHGNLAEYAPIGLLLIACLELNGSPWWLTLVLATLFCLGRLIHPVGMINPTPGLALRVRGMQLTLLSLIALALSNIAMVIRAGFFSPG